MPPNNFQEDCGDGIDPHHMIMMDDPHSDIQ